ncbi:uncharacterized protein [Arachis hypogaea]|uniref:uncharacterized protein isoform X3 n=1 Tax=Arachis hypogaea TaxID=3818 RepID=UPI000DEC3B95|nr:uncharacterized protein LOC112751900 isoform X3 [Arachis hypogaea]
MEEAQGAVLIASTTMNNLDLMRERGRIWAWRVTLLVMVQLVKRILLIVIIHLMMLDSGKWMILLGWVPMMKEKKGFEDDDDLVKVQVQGGAANDDDNDDLRKDDVKVEKFSGKDGIRRSNLLPKQVISITLSLGFVTQLWVDTTAWMVLFVEMRPNLLSGNADNFLLEDISQVGDVVFVPDESMIDNEFKMVGLETLVGYKVVTPSQRNIGKVSTYSLLVEDVLEVVSDAVVVREAATSRIQRLSKGFLATRM